MMIVEFLTMITAAAVIVGMLVKLYFKIDRLEKRLDKLGITKVTYSKYPADIDHMEDGEIWVQYEK